LNEKLHNLRLNWPSAAKSEACGSARTATRLPVGVLHQVRIARYDAASGLPLLCACQAGR
jgi:hypothetical protein